VLGEWLDTIENVLALTTVIRVRRHGTSIRGQNAGGSGTRVATPKLWKWWSGVHGESGVRWRSPKMKERSHPSH